MKAISSVYGFILIYLLSMASIQTWSSAVGSMENIQTASDRGHQLQELQALEHLSLSLSGSNLTIANDGQIPSTVAYLRLLFSNSSRTVQLDAQLAVGASTVETVPVCYTIEAVTSLGDVFTTTPLRGPADSVWSATTGSGGPRAEQLFGSPYFPSLFFVSSGAQVYAFSGSGRMVWSFDAGAGVVTDVMPISTGQVYVSVGYGTPSNAGTLYELSSNGGILGAFTVRVVDSPDGSSSVGDESVAKGEDSGYVYYDGWFYSSAGPAASIALSGTQLAAAGASSFYLYSLIGGSSYGGCMPWGNEMIFQSFSPGAGYPGGLQQNWNAYAYLGPCTRYDPQLVSAGTGGGDLAVLFAAPYFSDSELQALPGYNPYVVVVSSSGETLLDLEAPSNGYSSVATDGSEVYLALPQLGAVQTISLSTQAVSTYYIGEAASTLLCLYGHLFAVSQGVVKVYDGSMNLVKTISLAPLTLASYSNDYPFEPALQAPSFLVLNSTAYAALVENSTGSVSLLVGDYA